MNDDTLTQAFDRMTSAVAPPAAADDLVASSRARLRRRRRLTTGVAATSVLAIAAAGAAVASTMGTAAPNPAPMASADATSAPDQTASDEETSSSPTCTPAGKRIWSLKELQAISDEIPDAGTLLSMDLEGDPPRAWMIKAGDGPVLELELKKKGDRFVIGSAQRCAN